jgi:hypothetical protein
MIAALARAAAIVLLVTAPSATPPEPGAWTARLESLRPEEPMAYFELAEEIADVATSADDQALARRLFGLAGALAPKPLGRSSALALADLAEDEAARRRLLALALLLGGADMRPPAPAAAPLGIAAPPEAAMALVEAFSAYRRGRGAQAQSALRKPGAMELLEACDRFLPGGTRRFLEDCKLYRGQLRPSLSSEDIDRMLRLEVALLAGAERPWSSELLLTRGSVLVEVDPSDLEIEFGVDGSRPYYRGSRWVSAPSASSSSATSK